MSVLLRQRAFFVLRTASNKQLGTGDKRHFGIGGAALKEDDLNVWSLVAKKAILKRVKH